LGVFDERSIDLFQVFHLLPQFVSLVWFLKVSSGHINDLISFVLSERSEKSFVKRIITQNNFIAFLNKFFDEGRKLQNFSVTAAQIVYVLLSLLHALDVVIEGSIFRNIVGGVPSGQNSQFVAICVVFNDAQLDVLLEVFPEFVESVDFLVIS
jgi:hypothetical protein